jgi:molecular chaperone DnaJ
MPRDYYVILGITRTASAENIKQAYRRIAKRFHPDRAHSKEATERFLEARDAYETLSDSAKRRDYDASLERQVRTRVMRPPDGPVAEEVAPRGGGESPLKGILDAFFPGVFERDEERILQRDPHIEIMLSPQEALRGGCFPVTLQLTAPCEQCGGRGRDIFWECPACRGRGRAAIRQSLSLSLPPGIRDGTTATLSMAGVGFGGMRLHLRVRVAASPTEF